MIAARGATTRLLAIVLVIAACLAFGVFAYDRTVSAPVAAALADEADAQVTVHRRHWISGDTIVVDVAHVRPTASMAGMTRELLKAAEALKDRSFARVYLASRGRDKFMLDGAYFRKLGAERATQNPIYTIRTMPENVMRPDGTPAFGTWSGGWLGVMGKQMDDNNSFHRQWWVDDAIGATA